MVIIKCKSNFVYTYGPELTRTNMLNFIFGALFEDFILKFEMFFQKNKNKSNIVITKLIPISKEMILRKQ